MQSQKLKSGSHSISPQVSIKRLLAQGLSSAAGVALAVGAIAPVEAASLTNWQYSSSTNQLELTVKDGTTPHYFLMAQPARIVVDLPDTSVGEVAAQQTYSNGAVRNIRVSQFQPGLTRIVMELSPDVSLAPGQVKLEKAAGSSRWVLRPLIAKAPSSNTFTAQRPHAIAPTKPTLSTTSQKPNSSTSFANPNFPHVSAKISSPTTAQKRTPLNTSVEPTPPVVALPATPKPSPSAVSTKPASPNPAQSSAVAIAAQPTPPLVSTVSSPTPTTPVLPVTPTTTTPTAALSTDPPVNPTSAALFPPPSVGTDNASIRRPSSTKTPTNQARSNSRKSGISAASAANPSDSDDGIAVDTAGGIPLSVPPPETTSSPVPKQPSPPVETRVPSPAIAPSAPVPAPRSLPTANVEPFDIPSTTVSTAPGAPPTITVPPLDSAGASSTDQAGSLPFPPTSASPPVPLDPLPPTTSPVPPTVSVPQLPASVSPTIPVSPASPSYPSVSVPQSQPVVPSSSVIRPPASSPTPHPQAPIAPNHPQVVEFGQPLPPSASVRGPQSAIPSHPSFAYRPLAPDVLLPAGAVVDLRYPGQTALALRTGTPQQEVLLLQSEIRDSSGNVIAPQGTAITGRFETTSSGSRFIAQAISFQGKNVPFAAQSDSLGGNRKISDNALIRNAGIGILAGGLLGLAGGNAGLGAIGGVAAGAATSFLTAPKPATIQPGQVLQLRLTQDFRQP